LIIDVHKRYLLFLILMRLNLHPTLQEKTCIFFILQMKSQSAKLVTMNVEESFEGQVHSVRKIGAGSEK